MVPETRRLLSVLFRVREIADRSIAFSRSRALGAYLGGFLRPSDGYFVWERSDPRPFFADIRFYSKSGRCGGLALGRRSF
jgi:hypothetical protein